MSKVQVIEGPLPAGHPAEGPYDAILVNGSVPEVPGAWDRQLKESGRLVAIVGEASPGRLTLFTRSRSGLSSQEHYDAGLAPLPGFERAPTFVF
jgi:protein-L-isoaspartate(D-aspartate) O-methyltransferase